MTLPLPGRTRWQPLRSGLVDIYRYDEQEFVWEDGRLLLRGNNGTGKSRVLALQLPFLLDGEVGPHRLEPDGDPAKRIEWNLLLDRYERRVGYTWLEFGRLDEHGDAHYLTLGCGLAAVRGKGSPARWFFLTSKRMGEGLHLLESRVPLNRERLRAVVGNENVYDTVDTWRQAVDRALFRLGARYRALLDLLVQLRQPQLSRELDEAKLSRALSTALPPLPQSVVEPLAEAFRALETDRAELDGFRQAVDAASEFLRKYRSYAAVAARRRAARLRSSHAAYEDASRKALRATEALAEASVQLETAKDAHAAATAATEDAATRLQTLQQAPAMDLARELEHARIAASQAETAETRAATVLYAARTREEGRRHAAESARRESEEAARAAEEKQAAFGCATEPVGLVVEPDRPAWERALDRRQRAAQQLESAEAVLSDALERQAWASRQFDERRAAKEHALEQEVLATQGMKLAAQALRTGFASWSPVHLVLAPNAVLEALDVWLDDPSGKSPIEAAVAEAERVAIAEIERARAALGQVRRQLASARSDGVAEIDRLSRGGHAAPPPSPARERHSGLPGAPLWRLCDFTTGVPDADRRGLEAALEGAGLLDAWVTPAGDVLGDGIRDAALTLRAPVAEPSLTSMLVPLEQPDVPVAVVLGILARIGLGHGTVWVGADGRYGLGPLRGAWHKAEAEHIGEAAREAARGRRIEELRTHVADLDARLVDLERGVADLDVLAHAVQTEASARPEEAFIREAAAAASYARQESTRAQARLVVAEATLNSRRQAERDRRGERDILARDLGLVAWLGRPRDLGAALAGADRAAVDYFGAARRHLDLGAAARRAQSDLQEATFDRTRDEALTVEAARSRREAEVRRDTLQESHGAEVGEILAAIEGAKRGAVAASEALKACTSELQAADREEARATQSALFTSERAETAEGERDGHVGSVRTLVDAGLLTVLEVPAPDALWSTSRAVDLARRLEEVLATVTMDDAAWTRVQEALHRDLEDLRRSLIEHRWDPVLRTLDDLCVVEVSLGDAPLRVPELRVRLAEEVRSREAMLTAREREVIENHLVGELATALHDLLHKGERLVREMSRQVEARSTSTGMRLRFAWRLREEAGPAVADARSRLMRQGVAWAPADRDLIAQFLKARLESERAVDGGATWQQQIERAFDYRDWHSFVVERHQDGQWKALTKRTHGTGSGGEKAIALTIPQLAAAAAYYEHADPLAPRLILLDEAFVGVDNDMRAKCMGLLAQFDLDFMMTSEREWACYATLPGVAICQLVAQPGIDAIDVVRWVWNGRERRPA